MGAERGGQGEYFPTMFEILSLFHPNIAIIRGVKSRDFSELEEVWTVREVKIFFFRNEP